MTIPSTIGLLIALIAIQWTPVPKWRLLAGLVALGMIVTGIDILAVASLPQIVNESSVLWWRIIGGSLIGLGVGYFVRWLRYSLFKPSDQSDINKCEQDEDGDAEEAV